MIFRLSQKLGQNIKFKPSERLPLDANAFADWSAHLFTAARAQYVILTNTPSLYSVLMLGRGIANEGQFVDRALSCIGEFMAQDEQDFVYEQFIAPAAASIRFSTALNRSVIGSMNDLIYIAKVLLTEDRLSLHEASSTLNQVPMSSLKYAKPRQAFELWNIKHTVFGGAWRDPSMP
jgi:hypothetical protein